MQLEGWPRGQKQGAGFDSHETMWSRTERMTEWNEWIIYSEHKVPVRWSSLAPLFPVATEMEAKIK